MSAITCPSSPRINDSLVHCQSKKNTQSFLLVFISFFFQLLSPFFSMFTSPLINCLTNKSFLQTLIDFNPSPPSSPRLPSVCSLLPFVLPHSSHSSSRRPYSRRMRLRVEHILIKRNERGRAEEKIKIFHCFGEEEGLHSIVFGDLEKE